MAKQMLSRAKVLQAARKALPIRPDRQLREYLDYAGMDAAEAYRCGVEEAQGEIVGRLEELPHD